MKNIYVIEPKKVQSSEIFNITIEIPHDIAQFDDGKIVFYNENGAMEIKQMKKEEEVGISRYSIDTYFTSLGKYYFFFIFNQSEKIKEVKLNRSTFLPELVDENKDGAFWIVEVKPFPDWATDKIAYQIFVDRFYSAEGGSSKKEKGRLYRNWGEMPNWHRNSKGEFHNNDFFCGNIKGITEKIDYFTSLSVGIIYISPITKSLYRYERYAATDHMQIDPDAGTFVDLEELHKKANKNNIHIIMDIAFNHCGSDNPIFQEAIKNPNSEYRNWFYIDENNNYQYWYGLFKDMPIFRQDSPGFRKYVKRVVEEYAPFVDGFRLDLAEVLQPFLLEDIRESANRNGKHLIVGECWQILNDIIAKRGLYTPTNYLFTDAILHYIKNGEYQYLCDQINYVLFSGKYPQYVIDTMFNSLDTHDMMRAMTILSPKPTAQRPKRIWAIDEPPSRWHVRKKDGSEEFLTDDFRKYEADNDKLSPQEYAEAKRRLKIAVILQYFLPGIPCIYYGTEVGICGYKDPFNRKCYPWDSQDTDLLSFYQNIGQFRTMYIGAKSSFRILNADKDVFAFERSNSKNTIFVAINRGNVPRTLNMIDTYKQGSKHVFSLNVNFNQLLPYGGIVILK